MEEQAYDYNERVNWYALWEVLHDQGMGDTAGSAEYRRRTAELIEVELITDEAGEPITEFKQEDLKYPHDKLYITKLDALRVFFGEYFDGKLSFLVNN